jgi:hypothetical protein
MGNTDVRGHNGVSAKGRRAKCGSKELKKAQVLLKKTIARESE